MEVLKISKIYFKQYFLKNMVIFVNQFIKIAEINFLVEIFFLIIN